MASLVVDYLTRYEERDQLDVRRSVSVRAGSRGIGHLVVHTGEGDLEAEHVISATGTWSRPFVPRYPGSFASPQPIVTTIPSKFANRATA